MCVCSSVRDTVCVCVRACVRVCVSGRDTVCVCVCVSVRDTFCSYGVMELCSKGLGTSMAGLRARGVNLACVRTLCVIAEERPRIQLTTSFSKLFSSLGLCPRAVSTSFGCRVNVGICLQVTRLSSYASTCN